MTQRTKAAVATQISTLLADNTAGDISASDVRSISTDLTDSLVGGPASATDNTLPRFDSTTGQLIQGSAVVVDDSNNVSGVVGLTVTGAIAGGSSSDIAINTNKFTVAASSGNTLVAGTLTASGNVTASTYVLSSVGTTLTAAGTTRTDALQLAKAVNNITTAAASTGVILPVGVAGMTIWVYNNGANPVQVYATSSETINGTAGSTGVALANAKTSVYHFVAANTWLATLIN